MSGLDVDLGARQLPVCTKLQDRSVADEGAPGFEPGEPRVHIELAFEMNVGARFSQSGAPRQVASGGGGHWDSHVEVVVEVGGVEPPVLEQLDEIDESSRQIPVATVLSCVTRSATAVEGEVSDPHQSALLADSIQRDVVEIVVVWESRGLGDTGSRHVAEEAAWVLLAGDQAVLLRFVALRSPKEILGHQDFVGPTHGQDIHEVDIFGNRVMQQKLAELGFRGRMVDVDISGVPALGSLVRPALEGDGLLDWRSLGGDLELLADRDVLVSACGTQAVPAGLETDGELAGRRVAEDLLPVRERVLGPVHEAAVPVVSHSLHPADRADPVRVRVEVDAAMEVRDDTALAFVTTAVGRESQ